jgi:hypothetical protein
MRWTRGQDREQQHAEVAAQLVARHTPTVYT